MGMYSLCAVMGMYFHFWISWRDLFLYIYIYIEVMFENIWLDSDLESGSNTKGLKTAQAAYAPRKF